MKKVWPFFLGLVGCFFPLLTDLISGDSRHPTFSYWFAGIFRPISPVTKKIMLEIVSKYFLVASCICLLIYSIFVIRWFLLKTSNPKDYTAYKSTKYPLNWLLSLIFILVLQIVYWFIVMHKSFVFNAIGFTYLLLFLTIINLSTFLLLPLSFFFPSHYSNIPFFSSKR
jgi:hypothetical protein